MWSCTSLWTGFSNSTLWACTSLGTGFTNSTLRTSFSGRSGGPRRTHGARQTLGAHLAGRPFTIPCVNFAVAVDIFVGIGLALAPLGRRIPRKAFVWPKFADTPVVPVFIVMFAGALLAQFVGLAAIIGIEAAETYLDHDPVPTSILVRSDPAYVDDVMGVLAATANPENPEEVEVARPTDALEAKEAADDAFTALFLGLGAVALLVDHQLGPGADDGEDDAAVDLLEELDELVDLAVVLAIGELAERHFAQTKMQKAANLISQTRIGPSTKDLYFTH